jgi:hypothetical protein
MENVRARSIALLALFSPMLSDDVSSAHLHSIVDRVLLNSIVHPHVPTLITDALSVEGLLTALCPFSERAECAVFNLFLE